jgi:hypothetical protein
MTSTTTNPYDGMTQPRLATRYAEGRYHARDHSTRTSILDPGHNLMESSEYADNVAMGYVVIALDEADKYPTRQDAVDFNWAHAAYWQGYRDEAEAIEAEREATFTKAEAR